MGGRTWWTTVLETEELIAQSHKTPSLWWSAPMRVVLKDTWVCVAEAKDKEELEAIWTTCLDTVNHAKQRLLVVRVSGWLLQELFAGLIAPLPGSSSTPPLSSSLAPSISAGALEAAVRSRSVGAACDALRDACSGGGNWWDAKDGRGMTAVMAACGIGNGALVKRLVQMGADVNVADGQGWTALHVACEGGNMACAMEVLQAKEVMVMQGTKEGSTALHYAARVALLTKEAEQQWEQVATIMLQRACPMNVRNANGETPLMQACLKGRLFQVSWLLKQGASTKGCVEMALRAGPQSEAILQLVMKHGTSVEERHLEVAKENHASDTVIEILRTAMAEDEEFHLLDSSMQDAPTDDTPCGICHLPLGSAGPPLGCIVCANVRCGRCIRTFSTASICLSCSALTSPEEASRAFLREREDVPESPAGALVSMSPWLWGKVLGVFQGWRSAQSIPGVTDIRERFSLPESSVLLDAWMCSIRGVYFHLFAFSGAFCFALSTNDTSKAPSKSNSMDMLVELSDVETCSYSGAPDYTLSLQTRRYGQMDVVPYTEPLHWMGNVCMWLFRESRSSNPNVRAELVGAIREPELASLFSALFPQINNEVLAFTFPVRLSIHGGPPWSGRIFLSRSFLCFAEELSNEAQLNMSSSSGAAQSPSDAVNTSMEELLAVASPADAIKTMRLRLSLKSDVSTVDKEAEEGIIIRGTGGTWTLSVDASQRDMIWEAIRGSYEACGRNNCDPNLPRVLVVDDGHEHTELIVSSLLLHSLASRVKVVTYEADRLSIFVNRGCAVMLAASPDRLVSDMKGIDVIILGAASSPQHPSFPVAFLSHLCASSVRPLPRVLVTAPYMRKGVDEEVLRQAKLLLAEIESKSFDPLDFCVLRYSPFVQDLICSNQFLGAPCVLHLPVKSPETMIPLIDRNDFVEAVRLVALFKPPALYFPGSFCVAGANAIMLKTLAQTASVVFDLQIRTCPVSRKDYQRFYSAHKTAWDTAIIAQWEGFSGSNWQSDIEMITGVAPTALPQVLHEIRGSVLDQTQGVASISQELFRRWNACAGGELTITQSDGTSTLVIPPPDCAPDAALGGLTMGSEELRMALLRAMQQGSLEERITRAGWTSIMHVLLAGPDRVAAESMFWWCTGTVMDISLSKEIVGRLLDSVAESMRVLGLVSPPQWKQRLINALFIDNTESIDVHYWTKLITRQASLLHSFDCLGTNVAFAPWPSDQDVDSLRLPIVGPGHPEWVMVQHLLVALRYRLAEVELLPKLCLTPAASTTAAALNPVTLLLPSFDFSSPSGTTTTPTITTTTTTSPPAASVPPTVTTSGSPTVSSNLTPSSDSIPSVAGWSVTEPCPALFKRVRDASGVVFNDLMRWLGPSQLLTCLLRGRLGGLQEISSTSSRSGSMFFRSRNGRYLVKTLPPGEDALLVQLMPEYVSYLEQHPQSLMPRFLALMRLQSPSGRTVSFLIMLSVFAGPVLEQYDLKGSKVARRVGGAPDALMARKDLDLTQILDVGPNYKRWMMETLELDTAWLEKRNVCDYSLLVGFANTQQCSRSTSPGITHQVASQSNPETVFYLGLIDTLTQYDMRKRGEHMVKSFMHNSQDVSAVDAAYYRIRFLKHIDSITE